MQLLPDVGPCSLVAAGKDFVDVHVACGQDRVQHISILLVGWNSLLLVGWKNTVAIMEEAGELHVELCQRRLD